jgi:hypothetical protein
MLIIQAAAGSSIDKPTPRAAVRAAIAWSMAQPQL